MNQQNQESRGKVEKYIKCLTFLRKMQITTLDLRLGSKVLHVASPHSQTEPSMSCSGMPVPHVTVTCQTYSLNTLVVLQWQKLALISVLLTPPPGLNTMFCTQSEINKHLSEKTNEFQPSFKSFYIYCLDSGVSMKQHAFLLCCFTR